MKVYLNDSVSMVISAVFILCILVKSAASDGKRSPTSHSQIQLSFAPLVKRASPTVVNISTNRMVNARNFSPLFDDPFFRQFFGDRSQLGSTSWGTFFIRCGGIYKKTKK
jgi:S1-C subfamily serine protease